METNMNHTGSDSGYDPMTGSMQALANSPAAATEFFNDTFVSKDEDHEFERDTDGNGKKGKVGLSNFQYLFEERKWPFDVDSDGEESITGRNSMAMALEAAVTGHPGGEMPTVDTPPHNVGQAGLMANIVESVAQEPERLSKYGFMSDSMGQMTSEDMPDIHRGLHPGNFNEAKLFPIAGEASSFSEHDLTRFLYTVGRNPEGYAAISLGQHSYTTNMMEYHFHHPDAYVADPTFAQNEKLKRGIGDIAKLAAAAHAGRPSPHIVSFVATQAEEGFNNAQVNVGTSLQGEGVPRQLDTED